MYFLTVFRMCLFFICPFARYKASATFFSQILILFFFLICVFHSPFMSTIKYLENIAEPFHLALIYPNVYILNTYTLLDDLTTLLEKKRN